MFSRGSASRATRPLVAATLLLAIAAGTLLAQDRSGLRQFMRKKLELSQGVLKGLTTEDYDLIVQNAKDMRALSEDSQWRVSPNINYLRLSNEFQALTDELQKKASAKNLDGAALAYVEITLNCVKCHKLVREEKLVLRDLPTDPSLLLDATPSP